MTYLKLTCDCECPTQHCPGAQISLKPNCTCGCLDGEAERRCLMQSSLYTWNSENCTCYSSIVEGSDNLLGLLNVSFSQIEIIKIADSFGFNLSDPSSLMIMSFKEMSVKFFSALPPSTQNIFAFNILPILERFNSFILDITAKIDPMLNFFLSEIFKNLPDSNFTNLFSNVVPDLNFLL